MVWMGAVLGLRWSDVAGLEVGSVDLLPGTVTIDQTVTQDGQGRPVFGPAKSTAGLPTAPTRLGHRDPRLTIATGAQVVADADRRAADAPGETFLKPAMTGLRHARAKEGHGRRPARSRNPA